MDKEKQRLERIKTIAFSLKEAKEQNKKIDDDKFVINICLRYGCTDRTAKEYIRLSKYYDLDTSKNST